VLDNVLDPAGAASSKKPAHPPAKASKKVPQAATSSAAVRIKNYVLDTNVLLHDPDALLNFKDNHVLLPIEVIEEIDKFKRETTERGQNARTVSRLLDKLRAQGSLSDGVPLAHGGRLRIIFAHQLAGAGAKAPKETATLERGSVDNRILALALDVRRADRKTPTILVTKDINLRLKADAWGLAAEDYETDRVNLKDLYTGRFDLVLPSAKLAEFRSLGELALPASPRRFPNEYCRLSCDTDPKRVMLGRVDSTATKLVPLHECGQVWGIKPRNQEQHFALDALLDERIKCVSLMGKAGTGKTLIALAAGLKRTVTDRDFRRLIVARPTISMGKELGFLPGSLEEKLGPWMQPIHDALEMLGDLNMGHESRRSSDLLRNGTIVVEALSYIRGRSIANQFMIVDEAQNLTPLEAKTILTRAGNGTKIILTGDPYQIDNPYVDAASNGFTYVVNRFRDQAIAAHVELSQGERSELAEVAANVL
jgi:PhoH-like ATPase